MRWVFFVLIGLILIPSAIAIGISPSRMHVDFTPNLQENITVQIINSGERDINATLHFEGDLQQYIVFEKTHKIIPKGSSTPFSFTLQLPAEVKKPGNHLIKVHAEEVPFGDIKGIRVFTSITGELYVRVPYSGKYAELEMTTKNVNQGEKVPFQLLMRSWSEVPMIGVTTIVIKDDKEHTVGELVTLPIVLSPLTTQEETIEFATDALNPGVFTAKGILKYDNEQSDPISVDFRVGTLFVRIVNLTKVVEVDKMNPFMIEVESEWNTPLAAVSGEIIISKGGKQVGNVMKTPSIALEPWERKTLQTFWDTNGVNPGKYDVKVIVRYENKTTTTTNAVEVVKPFKVSMTLVLSVVIILIILIDVFFWLRHRRKRDHEA